MLTLLQKIERNRQRQAQLKKYRAILRRIRLRIFDYQDAGKGEKADRVMRRCMKILRRAS